MTDLFRYVIQGLPFGCVYALVAVGLVLTYKTSGVFNLGYGAQAFVSGVVFYELVANHHWAVVPAAVVTILIVGPLLGLVLERLIFRHVRTATPLTRLVAALGLLVAIPAFVQAFIGQNPLENPAGLAGRFRDVSAWHFLSRFYWDFNQITTMVFTVVVAVGLTALFRWTAIGLKMRAVVESARMSELNGVDANAVSSFSWALSGMIAGLTGVLFAPLYPTLQASNYFTLLVTALAAAALGRLTSIPLTFVGGIALGVLEEVVRGYLPANSVIAQGFVPAFPFIVLVLVLLFWPGLRRSSLGAVDPLSGVDPPPPVPAAVSRPAWATVATRIAAIGALGAVLLLSLFVLDSYWLTLMTSAVIYAVIFMSITTVTGMGGQISLCQAAFAAVGAFTAYQFVTASGASVLLGMLVGAVVAAGIGAIIAIPALRLEGVYVALATIAFALVWDNVLVNVSWIGGAQFGLKELPRPVLFGIDFANNHAFFLLCMVVLGLAAGAVLLVRGGTTGHFLDAVRGSERAAASIGIDTTRAKITAFAVSGALAGLGGALLAIQQGQVNNQPNYVFQVGLFWVVIVVTLGMRSVQGAIFGGFAFALVPEVLSDIGLSSTNAFLLSQVLFGLGVITYAKYPDGIIEANTRAVLGFIERLRTGDKGDDRSRRRDTEEREPEPAALAQHPARTPS